MHPRELTVKEWERLAFLVAQTHTWDFPFLRDEFLSIVKYHTTNEPVIMDFCRPVYIALEDSFSIQFHRVPLFLNRRFRAGTIAPEEILEDAVYKFRLEIGR